MYVREENIPEENLDWHKDYENKEQKVTQIESRGNKNIIHPVTEHNKVVLEKKVRLRDINLKRTVLNFLDEHGESSFFLAFLTLPYIIGFITVSFILLNGGVPIDRFFSLREGVFHFELWSIGTYIFVTVGMIWLVMQLFFQRR